MLNLSYLLPEIFLSLSSFILLTFGVIYSKLNGKYSQQNKITIVSILILFFTLLLNFYNSYEFFYSDFFFQNSLIWFFKNFVLFSTILILFLSFDFYKKDRFADFEFPILILFSTLGMLCLLSSQNLLFFYLSIELYSLSSYVLVTFQKDHYTNTEAGLKYFLLGALSSGFLLLGCAIIYIYSGELSFLAIQSFITFSPSDNFPLLLGALFLIISLLFKLAAAPFHNWAPDVYEGTSTLITAYLSIVPKITVIGVLINFIYFLFYNLDLYFILTLSFLSSLIIGAIGGLFQTKIKRLFAYSAISHVGIILLGLINSSDLFSLQYTVVYLILYVFMNFITFSLLLFLFENNSSGNFIIELSGLSRFHPLLAFTFAFNLLSLAGIPPLAGFFGKLFILSSAISHDYYFLALIMIFASIISCFFYLRVVKWMFFKHHVDFLYKSFADLTFRRRNFPFVNSLIVGASLYLLITFIFFPDPIFLISLKIISIFSPF